MSIYVNNGSQNKKVTDVYVHNGNSFKKCYRMFVHNGTEFKLVKGVSFKRLSQWFAAPSDAGSSAQGVKASYPKCLAINEYGQALITRSGNYLGSGNAPKTQQSIIRYSHNDATGVDFERMGMPNWDTNGYEVDFFIPYADYDAEYGAVARYGTTTYTNYFGNGNYASNQSANALLSNKKFDTFDNVLVDLSTYSTNIKDMFIYYLSNVSGNIYVFKECFAKHSSNYVYPLSTYYVTTNFNVHTAGIVDVEKNFSLITTKYAPPTQNTLVFQNIRNTGRSWYHIWRINPNRYSNAETSVATLESNYTNADNTCADEGLIYLTNTHFFCVVKLNSQWYITKRSFTNDEVARINYPASYEHPYFHTDWENQEALYRHCPKITIENREGFILPNGNIVMCDTMEVIPPPFFLPIPTYMLADGPATRVAKIAYNDEIGEGYIAYVYHFSAGNELGYYYDRFRRIDAQ